MQARFVETASVLGMMWPALHCPADSKNQLGIYVNIGRDGRKVLEAEDARIHKLHGCTVAYSLLALAWLAII